MSRCCRVQPYSIPGTRRDRNIGRAAIPTRQATNRLVVLARHDVDGEDVLCLLLKQNLAFLMHPVAPYTIQVGSSYPSWGYGGDCAREPAGFRRNLLMVSGGQRRVEEERLKIGGNGRRTQENIYDFRGYSMIGSSTEEKVDGGMRNGWGGMP
jgi:hypothetical protein